MMSRIAVLITAGWFGSIFVFPELALADNILIENQGPKWKSGGVVANPLIVQAKKGDVIEIKVTGPHGFVTLDKKGSESPSPALDLVLACGEDPATKPNAVLREADCGGSRFKKQLADGQITASIKLELTDKFQSDVHFWCTVHQDDMWGTLKPKP